MTPKPSAEMLRIAREWLRATNYTGKGATPDAAGGERGEGGEVRVGTIYEACPSHPDDGEHECMTNERRCVYCNVRLKEWGCNGCGRFLSCAELNAGETRCEDCR